MSLNFTDLRAANIERLPLFKNAQGKPAHDQPDGSDWSPAEWMNAVIGEVGEAANFLKKWRRGDYPQTVAGAQQFHDDFGKELADVVIYLDLLAFQLRLDLGEEVAKKFNQVSEKQGLPVRLDIALGFVCKECGRIHDKKMNLQK